MEFGMMSTLLAGSIKALLLYSWLFFSVDHVVKLFNQNAVYHVLQEVASLLYGEGAMGVVNVILEHCVAALQVSSNDYGKNKFWPCG
jgi:hypothetical protein